MGNKKRRQDSDGDEDPDRGVSDSDAQARKATRPKSTTSSERKASKRKTVKKPRFDDSESEPPPAREQSKQLATKVLKNAEGESYVDLGRKKRAAVRSFKGQVFVDIREFYGTDGDEKPGKKGISLAIEQWEVLKSSINTIDLLFAEHKK